ncbi:cell cycle checkpoint control protein Rad9 [Dermacentor variabilis]|uniref:cell cycle checkpoint control protein Rad9 n=1 Tax=Dermacentor variabilis TaxID=34621 RepID=UPI003F5B9663
MKYTIPGPNVKLFGRAVQTLTKIGDEVYVIADDRTLSLKAFSASRSSYMCFSFEQSFFSTSEFRSEGYRGKLSARSSLLAFRSVQSLDRTVEECVVELTGDQALIALRYRRGLTKRFWLPLVEYEELQFSFRADSYARSVCGQAKLLSDVLGNFPVNVPEVTLRLSPERLDVFTHLEGADTQRSVRTSVSVQAAELDDLQCSGDVTELTVCLRGLRAALGYYEGLTVRLQLDEPGMPLVGRLDGVPGLEAIYVAATLAGGGRPLASSAAPPLHKHRPPRQGTETSSKRHRAFLLGLTRPPLDEFTSQLPRDEQVLAEESDEEEG